MAKESNATSDAIKFERLNTIVLHSLPSLVCFYSGNQTLELTSLITVHIRKCFNMKFFSERVIYAESFQGIQTESSTSQDLLFHQDLNTTVKAIMQRKEFFDAMVEKHYRSDHWLGARGAGNSSVATQNEWLRKLRALKLDKRILPYVIPSAILHLLNNLEELEVQDSDKVEVIFDLQGTQIEETPSQLMKLTLLRLPELTHVWGKNGKGVLIFRNLQEVIVSDCGNLQTLFPASVAKNLEKLEKLEIKSCHKMQAIVEKEEKGDEDVHKGDGEDKYENEMIFQNLKVLNLDSLPKFESFYTGSSTLKFPFLKEVSFKCCGKKLFHHGDKVPKKLKVTTDGFHWEDDANSAIKLFSGKKVDGFPWEDDANSAIKLLFKEEAT